MKSLTLILIILFVTLSCKSDKKESSSTIKYSYGEDIFYLGTVAKINQLEKKRDELIAQIENGHEELLPDLDEVYGNLENLDSFKSYILEMDRAKKLGGIIPFPPPTPLPCDEPVTEFVGLHCQPDQDFTNVNEIVKFGFDNVTISIFQNDIEVANNFDLWEDEFGQETIRFNTNFQGEAIMFSTIEVVNYPTINLVTPVFID